MLRVLVEAYSRSSLEDVDLSTVDKFSVVFVSPLSPADPQSSPKYDHFRANFETRRMHPRFFTVYMEITIDNL